jgi:membrane fusion protein
LPPIPAKTDGADEPRALRLYRQEALDFQREAGRLGEVAALQSLPGRLLAWGLVGVVALALVFLSLAQYSRKETVAGYLAPTGGTARIHADQRGVIRAVHVRQGELVARGQPLLTVESDQFAAGGGEVNAGLLATLSAQRESLARNIQAEQDRAGSERRRLEAQTAGLQAEIAELQAQATIQAERIQVAEGELAATAQLAARGWVSGVEQKRRLSNLLEQKQALNALRAQVAERRTRLADARAALEQLPASTAGRIQGLQSELSGADQRATEIEGRRAYVLRSPVAGRVATLQAAPGQSVEPTRLQMEIVPAGSALQAELFVPARAIGFVRPGQRVRILYDAFPYQHFGAYGGRVVAVSQTILTGADVGGPVALKEPAYRVVARLDRPDVDAYGRRMPLQPDMPLRADVILDRRPVIAWLLDPLLRARR